MIEDKNKTLSTILSRVESAEKSRDANYKELWARCYKRWRNKVDPILDEKGKILRDQSNISIPYTYTQVETILPRIIETLFASRPYVTVLEREPSDKEKAEAMQTLLDWQMNERMDMQELFHTGVKEMLIYGTAVAYVGWKWEERKVIRKMQQPVAIPNPLTGEEIPLTDDMTGEPITELQPVQTNEIEYDDPEVSFIDLGLFYADSKAEDIDDARYCGHLEYKTKKELQELHDDGVYKIDWSKVPKDNKTNEAKDYRMNQIGITTNSDNEDAGDKLGTYEVLHYWEDDRHVVILNRTYIALDSKNPFWHKQKPYRKGEYTKVPHEFYGMGVVEIIEDLQDELNTERNQRIDYRNFVLRRMWKVRKGANIDHKELRWRQGGILHVEDMNDVQEFQVQDLPQSSWSNEETTKQDIRDATGAHDVVMGANGPKETATTTMTKDNNAAMRFRLIISSIENSLLVGITRLMMSLNQQFIDSERIVRLTNKGQVDWANISPEDIQGEFDMIAAGSSVEPMANKEAYKQRMIELFQLLSNDPLIAQFPDKRRNLLKKVLESYGIKDTDSIIPTDEDFQSLYQAQMQQQQVQDQQTQEQAAKTQAQEAENNYFRAAELDAKLQKGGGANRSMQAEGGLY